jgi:hypothetical protein
MKHVLVTLILTVLNYGSSAGEISKDRATPITSVPYTISSPGIYYLANDITSSKPNGKITIAANNVVLDLAGHTLQVATPDECILLQGTGGPTDFFPRPSGPLNVTVQNGTLINTIAGCISMAGNADVIEHVTMLAAGQNAFIDDLGFFNRISNCNISAGNPSNLQGPFLGGIYASSAVELIASGDVFENNVVSSSWTHGATFSSVSHYNGGNISNAGNAILNNVFLSFGFGSVGFDPLDANIGNSLLGPTK